MAPQLGMGSFIILDGMGQVVGYATKDPANGHEYWALRKPGFGGMPFPDIRYGGPTVQLTFCPVADGMNKKNFCNFIQSPPNNENYNHFDVIRHEPHSDPCP